MKWPRGKYNDKRIVGIGLTLDIFINYWRVEFHWKIGCRYIHIGPIIMRFEWNYDFREGK